MTVAELEAHKAKLEANRDEAIAKPGCSECTKNSYRRRIREVEKMIDKRRKQAAQEGQ